MDNTILYKTLTSRGPAADIAVYADASAAPPTLIPCQTHSCNIMEAHGVDNCFPDTDALICRIPGIRIGVRTADCVPVVVFALDINAVAAIHAGWKGTLNGIVTKTICRLKDMGASPAAAHALIGPCICHECYEVDNALADRFRDAGLGSYVTAAPGTDPLTGVSPAPARPHLDLPGINRHLLIAEGLPASNIISSGICTRHTRGANGIFTLPSWRREQGTDTRLLTTIMLRELS